MGTRCRSDPIRAENVLEPAVLREMARVRQKVMDLSVGDVSWADVCLRVPIITKPKCLDKFNLFDSFFGRRRKRATAMVRIGPGQ